MERKPLISRVPDIWRRLDREDQLKRYLEGFDNEFDRLVALTAAILDIGNTDGVPDKYLGLLGSNLGHEWQTSMSYDWNRKRIRHAIPRASYKGTVARLTDDIRELGAESISVQDNASKLLILSKQGRLSEPDSYMVTSDFWHDGAFLLRVVDSEQPGLLRSQVEPVMRKTVPAGTIWYLEYGRQLFALFDLNTTLLHGQALRVGDQRSGLLGFGQLITDYDDNDNTFLSWLPNKQTQKSFFPIYWHRIGNTAGHLGFGTIGDDVFLSFEPTINLVKSFLVVNRSERYLDNVEVWSPDTIYKVGDWVRPSNEYNITDSLLISDEHLTFSFLSEDPEEWPDGVALAAIFNSQREEITVVIDMATEVVVSDFSVTMPTRIWPTGWIFSGSNDNTVWSYIYEETITDPPPDDTLDCDTDNTTAYRYYRFVWEPKPVHLADILQQESLLYLECIASGLSGSAEPLWAAEGETTTEGTGLIWISRTTVNRVADDMQHTQLQHKDTIYDTNLTYVPTTNNAIYGTYDLDVQSYGVNTIQSLDQVGDFMDIEAQFTTTRRDFAVAQAYLTGDSNLPGNMDEIDGNQGTPALPLTSYQAALQAASTKASEEFDWLLADEIDAGDIDPAGSLVLFGGSTNYEHELEYDAGTVV